MKIFSRDFNKEPKVDFKDLPPKKGLALFMQVFAQEFWTLIKLNLLFVLFCIPVVTIPAATTASIKITLNMVREKNFFLWFEFFKCFKQEFKKSTVAGFILVICLALSVAGIIYSGASELGDFASNVITGTEIAVLFISILLSMYVYPMIAITYLNIGTIFKNALILIVVRLPYNLFALIMCGLLALAGYVLFPLSILLAIFCLFSWMQLITAFCAYSGLKKYVLQQETEQVEIL